MKQSIVRYLDGKEILVDMTEAALEEKIRKDAYITVLLEGVYHTVKASRITKTPIHECGGFWR